MTEDLSKLPRSQYTQYKQLKTIIEKGDFDDGSRELMELIKTTSSRDLFYYKLNILQIRLLLYVGKYSEAQNLASSIQNLVSRDFPTSVLLEFEILIWLFEASIRNHDKDLTKSLYSKGTTIYTRLKDKKNSDILELLGYFNYNISLLAREDYDLTLIKQQELLFEALDQFSKIDYKFGIALVLNNLGYAYFVIGDMQESLKYHHDALEIRKELGNIHQIAYSHANIGIVHRDLGKSKKGYHHLNEALNIWNDLNNETLIAEVLWNLAFQEYLFNTEKEIIKSYFDRISSLDTNNSMVKYYSKFIEVLMLKMNKRIQVKFKAVPLLEELIETDFRYEYAKLIQIELLIDLLIDEFKLYSEDQVLEEIRELMMFHFQLTKKMSSFYYQVNSLLFQSKFSLVLGEYETAISLLTDAYMITKENNLTLLHDKVLQEKEQLEEELKQWRQVLNQNDTITKRLQRIDVVSYLNIVARTYREENI